MKIVINIFGSPCAGKTTLAKKLHERFIKNKKPVSLVSEFATFLIAQNKTHLLQDQIFVTNGQKQLLEDGLINNDIAITDSPIELGLIYSKEDYKKKVQKIIDECNKGYESVNFFIKRPKNLKYSQSGRIHTNEQSKAIEMELLAKFRDKNFTFISQETDLKEIMSKINHEICKIKRTKNVMEIHL